MSYYVYTAKGQASSAGQSESGDVETNSQNVSATNSTVNVTDSGAIGAAFEFAGDSLGKLMGALDSSQKNQKEILSGTVAAASSPFIEAAKIASGDSAKMMNLAVYAGIGFVLLKLLKG